jgi:hypothetical protein
MMKHTLKTLSLFGIFLLSTVASTAQCAMCRAVIESDVAENGAQVSAGINNGILYLMGFPYLLIFGFLAYVFKDQIKEKFLKKGVA